jgi:HD-like signal output (HDOD) protein
MRVLFVDDEPNVLSGIRRMLRPHRKRWSMRFVNGGHAALAALEEEPADLLVSDIRMPGMSGVELLLAVRERWPTTLRMVLSGESDADALLEAVGPTHQYLCKPCRPDALVAALERMATMLELLVGPDLRARVGTLDRLPTPPAAFAAAMAVLNDPDGTSAQLAEALRPDIGMSTAVLRVANSAYVSSRAPVLTVERAIQLLGTNLVRAILMVAGVLNETRDHPSIDGILQRSREVSGRVRMLAGDAPDDVRQQAELAATLHNLGSLVMLQLDPDGYPSILGLDEGECRREEIARFGTDQATLGGYLVGVWGLPAAVMTAVARQDDPTVDGPGHYLHRALHALEEVA